MHNILCWPECATNFHELGSSEFCDVWAVAAERFYLIESTRSMNPPKHGEMFATALAVAASPRGFTTSDAEEHAPPKHGDEMRLLLPSPHCREVLLQRQRNAGSQNTEK